MQISIDITDDKISQLFTCAIEGGDPVTTAAKGGWCISIEDATQKSKSMGEHWYANPCFYKDSFRLKVVELDDEISGHETIHALTETEAKRGLDVMARSHPRHFAMILDDNIDAPCADVFLQCAIFGQEKYA